MQLYDEDKSCFDCFLHQEYTFGGRDWTAEKTWSVSLSESIHHSEGIKFAKLKTDKLPVPFEFSSCTVDLSATGV